MSAITGREVIDALQSRLKLEWFGFRPTKSSKQKAYPPKVIWRYDKESMSVSQIQEAEKAIEVAVNEYIGEIEWTIYFTGRNWVLLPQKTYDMCQTGKYRRDLDVESKLATEDP
jgi:hypothetical protein